MQLLLTLSLLVTAAAAQSGRTRSVILVMTDGLRCRRFFAAQIRR